MEEVHALRQLIDFGIPVVLLARECKCTPASIQNYISGRSIPSGTKILSIKEGFQHIKDELARIMGE